MRKRKGKNNANQKKAELGDLVEIEFLDSGASWNKSMESPGALQLGRLRWTGHLVRQDKEITAVDSGGLVADENYASRHEYHFGWTKALRGIKLIKKGTKNRR